MRSADAHEAAVPEFSGSITLLTFARMVEAELDAVLGTLGLTARKFVLRARWLAIVPVFGGVLSL